MPSQNSTPQKPTLKESAEITINLFPILLVGLVVFAGVAGFSYKEVFLWKKKGIILTINNSQDLVALPAGSVLDISWSAKNTSKSADDPCEISVSSNTPEGTIEELNQSQYAWIGSQPSSGSVSTLALYDSMTIMLTCKNRYGFKGTKKSFVQTLFKPVGGATVLMDVNGQDTNNISAAGTGEELRFTWTVNNMELPISCSVSDFYNIVLKQNLSHEGTFTVKQPKSGDSYYVNCIDANGVYAWDEINITD